MLRPLFPSFRESSRLACRGHLETPPSPSSTAFQTRNAFSPHKPALCQVWPQEGEMGVGGSLLDVT